MKSLPKAIQIKAKKLRKIGLSHRQISKKLSISLGSAFKYSKKIKLSNKQHLILMQKNIEKNIPKVKQILGGKNSPNKFKPKYSREYLIGIIRDFVQKNNRIPAKRELPHYRPFIRIFGSWNKAVRAAGFIPNSHIFSKKYIANDGHKCDSLSEKIIDDWLYARKIAHKIKIPYHKDKKLKVDFLVKDYWIEFFGLDGQLKSYDKLKRRKLKIINKDKINFIAIYPKDLFPKNKLNDILGFLKI